MLFGKVGWCWGPDSQQWFRYSVGCLLTGLRSLSSCWTWIAALQKWPTMQTASALRMRTVQNLPPITCQGPRWLRGFRHYNQSGQLFELEQEKSPLWNQENPTIKTLSLPWVFSMCFPLPGIIPMSRPCCFDHLITGVRPRPEGRDTFHLRKK